MNAEKDDLFGKHVMHVLIIPSEEFMPEHSHLAGIFQKHQALALQKAGCKVGVLSIRQSLSIPMLIKEIFLRISGKRINRKLQQKKWGELFSLLFNKSFSISKFITREDIEGLDVFRIDGFYFLKPNKKRNHLGWIKAGERVWGKYCAINGKPDIIHAHNAVYAGILANKISSAENIPYLLTEHSSFVARNLESESIQYKIEEAYQHAASFFVVSDFLGRRIDELYPTKLKWEVMPNVLDPAIEEAPMPAEKKSSDVFLLIAVGSLIPLKRHRDLIDAFYKGFAGDKKVQLKIAGDGSLKTELQEQINALHLEEQVQLAGRLNRTEVLQLIDQSHSLVLCSEIETFGVVLIESLSRGKPVIATRCGGPESIVNSENGLLCAAGDVDALSKAMLHIKETYGNYKQEQIRHSALTTYGNFAFGKQLLHKYEDVIS